MKNLRLNLWLVGQFAIAAIECVTEKKPAPPARPVQRARGVNVVPFPQRRKEAKREN